MRDFEKARAITASPDRLFAFVADVRNLSQFVPRVLDATARGSEELIIIFDAGGRAQQLDGWIRVDEHHRSLEWGIPAVGYQGWLTIAPADNGTSELTINVSTPATGQHIIYTDYELVFDNRTAFELEDVLDAIDAIMSDADAATT